MTAAAGIDVLDATLAGHGLCLRGWVFPGGPDVAMPSGTGTASAICLVGHAGGAFWPVFEAWRITHRGIDDPLDTWSKSVITPIAETAGGEAVFPSDRPWQPFQQWAMAAEGLKPSPLGMLIHPDYGLWHGYRGAILFEKAAMARLVTGEPSPGTSLAPHPCDTCSDKPCLSACPVEAFTPAGFAVPDCRSYLKGEAGRDGCMRSGCLARDACPVGRSYRYSAGQIRFHMTAFC
ncbi:ferredoxin [Hoeflea sp. AS16]|uniref:ferredoxin n=1 Tax=Hoeflea sp. AS16 TaxID=3135779 RepID=UPI00317BEFBE